MTTNDADPERSQLIEQILALPTPHLRRVAVFLTQLQTQSLPPANPLGERDWPHAPLHRLTEQGAYIVTGCTYEKQHYFRGAERLDHLETALLSMAKRYDWQLEAWAIFSNHYHFVAQSPNKVESLVSLIKELHRSTAVHVNELDGRRERRVWFNYWDTHLTFERSYLARLAYVHNNPVKHGLVSSANQYKWCSAAWFERVASPAQQKTLKSFKTDKISIRDEFDPI